MFNGWRKLTKKSVVVNLRSGKAFHGVLFDTQGDLLILKQAMLYDPEAHDPVSVDGDVVVERLEVEFIQVL
jgi:hypothetical protein